VLYTYNGIIGAHSEKAFWAAIVLAALVGLVRGLDIRSKQQRHIQILEYELRNIMDDAMWDEAGRRD
jgi:hypothetical protein